MAENICKRLCSTFYHIDDTLDGVPIPMRKYLESVSVFSEYWTEIIGVIDEKQYVVELVAAM